MFSTDKSVLVLAPHPDDETFGCGGTIRLLVESGTPVDILFMTKGELGSEQGNFATQDGQASIMRSRTAEALAACEILGVRDCRFLNGRDSQLSEQPAVGEQICERLLSVGYRRIFCPWQQDSHVDHISTFLWMQVALHRISGELHVWLYEVWKPLAANMFVPIDNTVEFKRRAMQQYSSQLKQFNYHEGFLGLSAYRSLFCPPSRYAEAFYVCTRDEVLQITAHRT